MSKEFRTITCTNLNGFSMEFGEKSFAPFVITDCDGVYDTIYNVTTQENGNVDGSTVVGQQMKERNIVLTIVDIDMFARNRELLDRLFSTDGTFIYDDGVHKRKIDYVVEKISGTDGAFYERTTQVSLICPNPHFSDIEDNNVDMSKVVPLFEFPHEFINCEEISRIEIMQNIVIDNQNGTETGMTITIEALGKVVNPTISIQETGEHMTVGVDGLNDFTLELGQKLIITTQIDNCHVYLQKAKTLEEVNMYLPVSADFIRLVPGTNHIGYTAKNGEENMTVSISFKRNYARA